MEPPSSSELAVIPRGQLDRWVSNLLERAEVIAPVRAEEGDVFFAPARSPAEVCWSYGNTLLPPKQHLLPQTDPIVSITRADGSVAVAPIYDDAPRVLLGLRSCDVSGIALLPRVHAADLPDDSYLRRAERATLVSLACAKPLPQCFCICSGAGPFLNEESGGDLQLVELDQGFLAEPRSDKGRRLLQESASDLLRPPREAELEARRRLEQRARELFGQETCHFGSAMRRVSTGRVEEALWDLMGEWCLECGGCNMVCPTCYCFSVKDRALAEPGSWTRCRIWDSCQYAPFTLEASGHNPRPRRGQRIRRRVFHKVSAQYYRRDGMVGCVGCGRCVSTCLGAATMPAVVAALREGRFPPAPTTESAPTQGGEGGHG